MDTFRGPDQAETVKRAFAIVAAGMTEFGDAVRVYASGCRTVVGQIQSALDTPELREFVARYAARSDYNARIAARAAQPRHRRPRRR